MKKRLIGAALGMAMLGGVGAGAALADPPADPPGQSVFNTGQCVKQGLLDRAADPNGVLEPLGAPGPAVINQNNTNNPANKGNTPFDVGVVCVK